MTDENLIQELSMLQQNVANISAQKQQFVTQLSEYDSALEALEKTDNAYKIVGNIMINSTKEDLIKDIKKKKEVLGIRIKSFEKQEEKLKEKADKMQKDIISNLDKGKK